MNIPVFNCFIILLFHLSSFSQSTSFCTFTDVKTQKQMRLEYTVNSSSQNNIFETSYLLFDKNSFPFKAVTVSNNTVEKKIYISVRELNTGKEELNYPYKYSEFAGLVVTEFSDNVSELNKPYNYLYLLSFESESKQRMELHFLSDLDNYTLLFKPVSDDKMKQNKIFLQQIEGYKKLLKEQEEKRKQEEYLLRKVDSLVEIKLQQKLLEDTKTKTSSTVSNYSPPRQLSFREKYPDYEPSPFVSKLLEDATQFYQRFKKDSLDAERTKQKIIDEIRREDPNLLIYTDREISYSTSLSLSGNTKNSLAWLLNKSSEYFGEVQQKLKEGRGFQKFKNGNYLLGKFTGDYLINGYSFLKDTNVGDYFGDFVEFKKTGYGELKDLMGDIKVGKFNDSELKNGYIKQLSTDGFQYIKVENGIYLGADNMNGQYFFEQVQKLKNN